MAPGLLALLLLLTAAGSAQADPIITPIIVSLGVTGTILGVSTASILSQVVIIAVGLGISMAVSALTRPPQPKPSDGQIIIKQAAAPRTRSYGRVKVGGVLMFANTGGGVLHRVIAMGSGEIDGVEQHWIDDHQVTLSGSSVSSPAQYLGHAQIEFRLGVDAPAVYSALVTAYPTLWTAAHLGKGIPSALMTMFQVPADDMAGVWPQQGQTLYRQVQRGAKVADMVAGALTTPAWSDNAARVIMDFLTHPDGLRLDPSWVVNAAADWEAAIAICNEAIDVPIVPAATEPRYRIWNTYRFDERPADVLARFLQACDASIFPTPARGISIKVGKWSTPTVTIDGDAIVGFSEFGKGRDILTTANTIRAQFTSPDLDYQQTDADPYVDDIDVAERGELAIDLQLFCSPSHSQTRRLQKLAYARANPRWVGTLQCNLRALPCMGERFVNVIIPELGVAEPFEVLNVQMVIVDGSILQGITVQVASISSDAYDWGPFTALAAPRTIDDAGTPPSIPPPIVPGAPAPPSGVIEIDGDTALPSGTTGLVLVNNTSAAPMTVTLPPSPTLKQTLTVKDAAGNATLYPITVDGGAEAIEGAPSLVIAFDYGWVQVAYSGSQWVQI